MRSLAKAGMRASVHRCRSEQIVCAPHQQGVGLRDQTGSITVCRVLRQESLVMRCRAPWLSLVYAVSISALFLNCRRPALSPNYECFLCVCNLPAPPKSDGRLGHTINGTPSPAMTCPATEPRAPKSDRLWPGIGMVRCNSDSCRHTRPLYERHCITYRMN